MAGIGDYGAFVGAIILFLLVPGPGNLALISSTTKGGFIGGLACTLGVIVADQMLMWAALGGLAALLRAWPAVFAAVQWIGAIYLFWLGLQMVRPRSDAVPRAPQFAKRHHFTRGLLVTLLNPKAVVFYMAFFPLFLTDPAHATGSTFVVMAATVAALTLLYGLVAACVTQAVAGRLREHPRWGRGIEQLAGLALIGFGVRLVLR